VHIERVSSAYRLGIAIALAYALWTLGPTFWPGVVAYKDVVVGSARASRTAASAGERGKLSPANLETLLLQSKQFPPGSQPQCEPAPRDWDYVCSYIPQPGASAPRLQFGVNVDAMRWVKVSAMVPTGAAVPAPQ
jgi:hypothetical protein